MPDIMGTIPQWISATSLVSLLSLLLFHFRAMRRMALGDTADIRDHYAEEVARFAESEKHLREMIRASDHRHEECEQARKEMRAEMHGLHDDIAGLKRQIASYSADRLIELEENGRPSAAAPHATASAPRVKRILDEGK